MSDGQKNALRILAGFFLGVFSLWVAITAITSLPDGPDEEPPEEPEPVVELY